MALRYLRGVSSLLDEFPITKKYQNSNIAPTILIISILAFVGLVIFNVFTQGKILHGKPFLSQVFVNHSMSQNGDNITCDPAPLALHQSFFTIPWKLENQTSKPAEELEYSYVSPGMLQWQVNFIGGKNEQTTESDTWQTRTGLYYSDETLNCTIEYVHVEYMFQDSLYSFGAFGRCHFGNNEDDDLGVFASWGPGPTVHEFFLNPGVPNSSIDQSFRELGEFYQRLSIPPNSLPLWMFPPGYNETQEDLYQGRQINPNDVTKLELDLFMTFTPPAESKEHVWIYKSNEFQSPKGNISASHLLRPSDYNTPVTTLYEFFASSSPEAIFSIKVAGIGNLNIGLRGPNGTKNTPEILQLLLNKTLDISGRVVSLASWDLHGSQIAVNYLCVNTKKEWQPPLKAFSIIAASTIGVFAAFFSLMGILARRIDGLKKKEHRISGFHDSHHSSTLTMQEEAIPLADKTVD